MLRAARLAVTVGCVLGMGYGLAPSSFAQKTEDPTIRNPVKVVADQVFTVTGPKGSGEARLFTLGDWSKPLPAVTRAIVLVHGAHRDADHTRADIQHVLSMTGTPRDQVFVVLPQFLTEVDADPRQLSPQTLRWSVDGWSAGSMAKGPAPISSYAVLDAILARLADPARFPALKQVVLAGHSAGGQMMQRYAIEGRGDAALTARGIHVRYVVANPSSYAYFTADRPKGDGFAPFDGAACPQFNHWKYGMEHLNAYAQKAQAAALEATYVGRDVIYLLGTADNDPRHKELDQGCSAEAEGPTRYQRGMAFYRYLRGRHPDLQHKLWEVPGVAHNGAKMFASYCGEAALLDRPGCGGK